MPRVDAVDTNGAGDVLHGAYCFYAGMGMLPACAGAGSENRVGIRPLPRHKWMGTFPERSGHQARLPPPN